MREGSHEQGEFDLGIEPTPKRLEGDALEEERNRVAEGIRRATEAQNDEQVEPAEPQTLKERLDRIMQPIRAADEEINAGVSEARRDQTSEVLVDHERNADVEDAQNRAEQAASDRRRVARQRIRDAQAAQQRVVNEAGREKVASHWTPPETPGQQAIREARERGDAARAARAKRIDTPDEAREAAEGLRSENEAGKDTEQD